LFRSIACSPRLGGKKLYHLYGERPHGILKDEYFLDAAFTDREQAQRACAEAIRLYNTRCPHWALGFKNAGDGSSGGIEELKYTITNEYKSTNKTNINLSTFFRA
jgi:transposase InsO family protein